MRYFIVTYYKKPDGQTDEVVSLDTRIRNRHWTMASVIMDFKDKIIKKSSLNGVSIAPDWDHIYQYYQQHYPDVFKELDRRWQPQVEQSEVTDKS